MDGVGQTCEALNVCGPLGTERECPAGMHLVAPPVRSSVYEIRSGKGADAGQDPTSYEPGQLLGVHLTVTSDQIQGMRHAGIRQCRCSRELKCGGLGTEASSGCDCAPMEELLTNPGNYYYRGMGHLLLRRLELVTAILSGYCEFPGVTVQPDDLAERHRAAFVQHKECKKLSETPRKQQNCEAEVLEQMETMAEEIVLGGAPEPGMERSKYLGLLLYGAWLRRLLCRLQAGCHCATNARLRVHCHVVRRTAWYARFPTHFIFAGMGTWSCGSRRCG